MLADLALCGDRSAFEELFERHFGRVYVWTGLRAPSLDDAERITSRALAHAFSDLARVASGEDMGLRALRVARALLRTPAIHASATESPR